MGIARMSSTIVMASSNDANSATGIKYKHVGEDNKVRRCATFFFCDRHLTAMIFARHTCPHTHIGHADPVYTFTSEFSSGYNH